MRTQRSKSKCHQSKAAFTLVELMVALSILTILAFGVLSGLLQARKMTEGTIYEATAINVANAYMEQIKTISSEQLLSGIAETSTKIDENLGPSPYGIIRELRSEGVEDSLLVSPLPAAIDADLSLPSETDIPNTKTIDINNTPTNEADDLSITVVVYVHEITSAADKIGKAYRLALRWSYRDPAKNLVTGTLYAIRSDVESTGSL